jgi:hypothetical protein
MDTAAFRARQSGTDTSLGAVLERASRAMLADDAKAESELRHYGQMPYRPSASEHIEDVKRAARMKYARERDEADTANPQAARERGVRESVAATLSWLRSQ